LVLSCTSSAGAIPAPTRLEKGHSERWRLEPRRVGKTHTTLVFGLFVGRSAKYMVKYMTHHDTKSIQIHPNPLNPLNPCTKFLHDIGRLRSNYSPGQVRSLQVMRGRPKPRLREPGLKRHRCLKHLLIYWIILDIAAIA
jgi:hypothetical protein